MRRDIAARAGDGARTFFASFFVSRFPSAVSSGGGAGASGADMADAAFCACSTSGSRSFEGPAPRLSERVMYGVGREPVSSAGNGLDAAHVRSQ